MFCLDIYDGEVKTINVLVWAKKWEEGGGESEQAAMKYGVFLCMMIILFF